MPRSQNSKMPGPDVDNRPASWSHRPLDLKPSGLRDRWREFWKSPDPAVIDVGAKGEKVIAKIRLLVIGLVLSIPTGYLAIDPSQTDNYVGFTLALTNFIVALLIFLLVSREVYRPWIGTLTSIFDGLLVTTALVVLLVLDQPHAAVNSKVIFPAYFLVLMGTCLRNDPRISTLSGAAITVEYALVVWYADTHWSLNDPIYAPYATGMFEWDVQYGRLIMLATGTLLCTSIVARTQKSVLLSKRDPLTGLFNRTELEERLREEASRSERHGNAYVVAMIDLDKFKKFNDASGHKGGDLALMRVAGVLRRNLRKSDIVARYGGDEFCVVFPQTAVRNVIQKLQEISILIRDQPLIAGRRGAGLFLTFSGGVASGRGSQDPLEVIEEADRQLFQAKQEGGNRIVGRWDEPKNPSSAAS